MDIEDTILNILRDHGIVDTGIASTISNCVEATLFDVIRENLNLAEMSSNCLQGILAADVENQFNYSDAADMAIEQAVMLCTKLDERLEAHHAGQRADMDS